MGDVRALANRLPDDVAPVVLFGYLTGWRIRSEVLTLTWAQVEMQEGVLRLKPNTTKSGEVLYPDFNDEEHALCDLLRGITSTSINYHNESMRALLKQGVDYREEIPEFSALQDHLDLWLSKYAATARRQDVCLVYVGVKESKRFPTTIDRSVAEILRQMAEDP